MGKKKKKKSVYCHVFCRSTALFKADSRWCIYYSFKIYNYFPALKKMDPKQTSKVRNHICSSLFFFFLNRATLNKNIVYESSFQTKKKKKKRGTSDV